MNKHHKKISGFSLIEIIIAVSILAFVFIASAAFLSNLLRAMKVNEHRVYATHYADEVIEWLRSEREDDWNAFSDRIFEGAANGDTASFCLNKALIFTDTITTLSSTTTAAKFPRRTCSGGDGYGIQNSDGSENTTIPQIYKRQVVFTKVNSSQINALVTVQWFEENVTQPHSVSLDSTFTVWENQ